MDVQTFLATLGVTETVLLHFNFSKFLLTLYSNLHKAASNQSPELIVEKNGELNLCLAATTIEWRRPPFAPSSNSSFIVFNSIKWPSSTLYT